MRYGLSEKLETIRIVEDSEFSIRQTLKKRGIPSKYFLIVSWVFRGRERGHNKPIFL